MEKKDEDQAIEKVMPTELLEARAPIEIQNLIVSAVPIRHMVLGDVDSLCRTLDDRRDQVEAVFWCEDEISLVMRGGGLTVTFRPEWHPATRMFFDREEKRTRYDEESDILVWEGEFKPVLMNKTNMVKYLKKYAEYFNEDVIKSIKHTRVTESRKEAEISLDDMEEDSVRREEEFIRTTNLPPSFEATMPIFEHFHADLQFEATLTKKEDYSGKKVGNYLIQLRLVNGREAIASVMKDVMERVPEDLPTYYGRYRLDSGRKR